ncbi:MAG: type VI secretion system-associated protein TagF [Gammaproteobacteria bacterium]|nr:type VI secretion system-associated protein TagF [Gammaproteobacteria bacterium]
MSKLSYSPGFYGKLPFMGDFVSRRLSKDFIAPWDAWLQQSLAAVREQAGDPWKALYFGAPIWRFALLVSEKQPDREQTQESFFLWAGLIMSSRDTVGRCFPLTLMVKLPPDTPLSALSNNKAEDWFAQAEKLLLSTQKGPFDLEQFDLRVAELGCPVVIPEDKARDWHGIFQTAQATAFHIFQLSEKKHFPAALQKLESKLQTNRRSVWSVWWSAGTASFPDVLWLCDGLPMGEKYNALLDSDWQRWGWIPSNKQNGAVQNGSDKAVEKSPASLPPKENNGEKDKEQSVHEESSKWSSCALTHVGNQRTVNEDACLALPRAGLWTVADGMGGYKAGDVASQSIINALKTIQPPEKMSAFVNEVEARLLEANKQVYEISKKTGEMCGSTVLTLLIVEQYCVVLWMGDSRIYRYRRGGAESFTRLTQDHSQVEEMVVQGLLSREEAESHPDANIITRALGTEESLYLDMDIYPVHEGDIFLLCSDGLYKEVSEDEIAEILARGNGCQNMAEALLALTLKRAAMDNITVTVVEIQQQNKQTNGGAS